LSAFALILLLLAVLTLLAVLATLLTLLAALLILLATFMLLLLAFPRFICHAISPVYCLVYGDHPSAIACRCDHRIVDVL
jgi:hypothetical protein